MWIARARDFDRCVNCLTPWKFSTRVFGLIILCSHCGHGSKDVDKQSKESQTEVNSYIIQESQTELQEGKAIIDNQRMQVGG